MISVITQTQIIRQHAYTSTWMYAQWTTAYTFHLHRLTSEPGNVCIKSPTVQQPNEWHCIHMYWNTRTFMYDSDQAHSNTVKHVAFWVWQDCIMIGSTQMHIHSYAHTSIHKYVYLHASPDNLVLSCLGQVHHSRSPSIIWAFFRDNSATIKN